MRRPSVRIVLVILLGALAAAPAHAQTAPPGAAPSVAATRLSGPAPHVDGRLDDAAWDEASPVTGFIQRQPQPGAPASERTEVRVLYDDDALYIGARLYDSAPDSVAGRLFRRDAVEYSDWFYVDIDSYFDRRTAFSFSVNPRGVRKDALIYNDVEEDLAWDAVWDAEARVDAQGWTAEMVVPLSQLRFSPGAGTWGINFQRRIARRGEDSYWSAVPSDLSAYVSRAGRLTGLEGLRPSARFEVMPYAVGRLDRAPEVPADPFYERNDLFGSLGADFKAGLTSDLTLTGTVNPDFGQVEVDPAVVNLTAFETFFPEQRPFFTEGSDIFAFGRTRSFNRARDAGHTYFYSRRIGRPPQGHVDGVYVDAPQRTTIAGAAKVTGRTREGWSVGVLDAVTPVERARFEDEAGVTHSVRVEPLTNYFAGRLRRDLRDGRTVVGGLLTAVRRDLGDGLAPLLHASAYVGGVDFSHAWGGRRWAVSGFVAGSRVAGDPARIARTQRASARYFQRPDADHLTFDPTRTSLSGVAGEVSLAKIGGTHWIGSLTAQTVSPGMEVNDIGFQTLGDRHALSTYVAYQERAPGPLFRRYDVGLESSHTWNYDGLYLTNTAAVHATAELHNLWTVSLGLRGRPWGNMDRLTRGGPLARQAAAVWVLGGVGTDPRENVSAEATFDMFWDVSGEKDWEYGVAVEARPTSAVQLSFAPTLRVEYETDQYVTQVVDPLATHTGGVRYVFGDLAHATVSLDTRLNWTFTPDLSLQLYVQPLVAGGEYDGYKEFRAPETFDFDYYGRDKGTITPLREECGCGITVDPDGDGPAEAFTFGEAFGQTDFTFRSLRSNMVLRWEYLPGSTLFLVWQHLRSGDDRAGTLVLDRDFDRLLGIAPENILQVKLTYWLGR